MNRIERIEAMEALLNETGDAVEALANALEDYAEAQAKIDSEFRDTRNWTRKSLMNIARSGKFSSDRTIKEYCSKIWNISK